VSKNKALIFGCFVLLKQALPEKKLNDEESNFPFGSFESYAAYSFCIEVSG
jgi:hypothetical protein